MKKITLVMALAVMFCLNTNKLNAQAYEQGSMVLNLGVGFGGYLASGVGVSGSFEVGIWPTGDFGIIGLGAATGYVFSSGILGVNNVNYTEFSVGPRGTYHFTIIPVENLDVYAAVQVLYVFQTTNYKTGGKNTNTKIYPGGIAGARYFFSDFFGVFAELGYGVTYVAGGIALKF